MVHVTKIADIVIGYMERRRALFCPGNDRRTTAFRPARPWRLHSKCGAGEKWATHSNFLSFQTVSATNLGTWGASQLQWSRDRCNWPKQWIAAVLSLLLATWQASTFSTRMLMRGMCVSNSQT